MNVKMKNIFKNILILAAAVFGFAACQEEVADVQGVVGDFAYIVDGTEAKYAGANCEVFHTPIGEMGEIATSVTVALTKVQKSDVNVVLALDNTSLDNGYSAFPEGVLKFNENVTIPAGQKEATVDVTVANEDFAKLADLKYQAIFRIASASGVKVSSNSNAAYLMVVTEVIDPADNIVNVTSSTSTFEIKQYHAEDGTVETVTADIKKTINISGSEPAFLPFEVSLAHAPELVAAYNQENGTEYCAVPEGVTVNITTPVTMEKEGTSVTSEFSISADDQAKLLDSKGYLIPVKVTDAGDATVADDCGVSYIIVKVKNIQGSAAYFSALYLGDYRLSTWYMFQNPIDLSNGYTYVFHVFIDEITDHSRIGDFADANENWINMLRYGQKGNKDTRLEWFVGPNGCRKQLYAPAIEAQKWYQYALVYNKNAYIMYLEGEEVARYTLTDEDKAAMAKLVSPKFQAIEFNSSWGANYRQGNEFHGRLWQVGVFNKALNSSWLKNYCYRDNWHPYVIGYASNGCMAYWPMDDGAGAVCVDGTGRYESIDFSKTTRCDDESSMTSADVSAYVQWKNDPFNSFD